MIRKQLYITAAQDAELKRRAAESGMTEAEFVRRALDAAFRRGPDVGPARARAAERLLAHAAGVRERLAPRAVRRWTREELYEERLARAVEPTRR